MLSTIRRGLMVAILTTLVACSSSVLDRKFKDDTYIKDMKTILQSKDVKNEDKAILSAFIAKQTFTGNTQLIEGRKYRDLLALAKKDPTLQFSSFLNKLNDTDFEGDDVKTFLQEESSENLPKGPNSNNDVSKAIEMANELMKTQQEAQQKMLEDFEKNSQKILDEALKRQKEMSKDTKSQ